MGKFWALLLAYIAAAPLTSLISLDLRETEWANILTYLWWGGGWLVWVFILAFVLAIVERR